MPYYLNFLDRDSGWQPDYVVWMDSAGIYGKTRAEPQTIDKEFITNRVLATKLVAIAGQIAALPLQNGKLTLAFDIDLFTALTPGTGFTLSLTKQAQYNETYRVMSRSMDDPAKPVFEVEISVDRSYLYTTTAATSGYSSAVDGGDSGGGKDDDSNPVPILQPIPEPTPSAIFQLPRSLWAAYPSWTNNFQLSVALLLTRITQADAHATLFLGRNYVFTGAAPDSFEEIATITNFAMYGAMVEDFLAATAITAPTNQVPFGVKNPLPVVSGLTIQLQGVDIILPDVSDFDALANSLLLFVGNEIMSVAEATMTSKGAYTLTVIRGLYGSTIADHHAEDTVWIIPLLSLQAIAHPFFYYGNTALFKVVIGQIPVANATSFNFKFGALFDTSGNQIIGADGNPIIPLTP